MNARVACLSPFDEATVRAMFQGRHQVDVVLVPPPPAQPAVLAACTGADLVIGDQRHKHRVDRAVLERMRGCKLLQMPSVGFDTVDYRAAAELGIPVANAAGYNKDAVADWTVMAMIALLRHSFQGDRALRAGRWRRDDPVRKQMLGRELGAVTVGIIGLGNVGSSVARRLTAFGTRILFTDVVARDVAGAERVTLDTLLKESEVICIHTPLDVPTGALIGAAELAKMKRGAFLINAARGPIVDQKALVHALRSGHLAGAGLDVYEVEPLPVDSPLRTMENVVLSPHAGGATVEADARLMEMVGDNLRRALDGQAPLNVVNAVRVGAQ
ncbi:MAG TPA: hydroxyacid dehydrogenase [Chloroflexi bacterium]|jgi:D-3-phosphoglycerate dehydrogenase|nr:hydroxyacid dehydrogenase [Chloroflexota bacterium]HAF20257.1 hydroxyacid dehydrogenase [Chloroflexota bacterium]